jgi:hypothetical protein
VHARFLQGRATYSRALIAALVLAAVGLLGISYFIRRTADDSLADGLLRVVQFLLLLPLPLLLGYGVKRLIDRD